MRPAKPLQTISIEAPATASNDVASGVLLSAVSAVLVGNYTTCHAVAAQLTSLQAWVRANGWAAK